MISLYIISLKYLKFNFNNQYLESVVSLLISIKMKSNSILKVFRKRDFFIIFLIALSFYLTYDSADFVYELEPSWYLPRGKSTSPWKAIPPIVTDMDGDG